ncbi:hypothetical protein GH983_06250 [Agrobacterium sp. MA01]|nr:hypothetical protein GH983_06250 [Agrobacterium sp. MA01]
MPPRVLGHGAFRAQWNLSWSPRVSGHERRPEAVASQHERWRHPMGRGILFWLIGVPIPLIILFLLFFR